jgi:hypothetical protein
VRQPRQPAGDFFAANPIRIHESLALAERGIEAGIVQRNTALDAGDRDLPLDGRELE